MKLNDAIEALPYDGADVHVLPARESLAQGDLAYAVMER